MAILRSKTRSENIAQAPYFVYVRMCHILDLGLIRPSGLIHATALV